MLNYVRKGAGEAIVLVHGFLGAKEVFGDVMEDLSSHYDVVAVDLPGHGLSKLEKDRYTVYEYARAVSEVLQHEGITEATWLGHSLGGYIVLAALEGDIAPIKRAILAYSYHGADKEEQREKRTKQQKQISEIGVEPFVDQIIGAFFSDSAKEEQIQFARQIGHRASEKGLIVALEAMKTRPNQQNFVDNTTTPILVIEGSEDGIVQPIQTKNENVQKVITKTGHLGMLEDPKSFTEGVKQFM